MGVELLLRDVSEEIHLDIGNRKAQGLLESSPAAQPKKLLRPRKVSLWIAGSSAALNYTDAAPYLVATPSFLDEQLGCHRAYLEELLEGVQAFIHSYLLQTRQLRSRGPQEYLTSFQENLNAINETENGSMTLGEFAMRLSRWESEEIQMCNRFHIATAYARDLIDQGSECAPSNHKNAYNQLLGAADSIQRQYTIIRDTLLILSQLKTQQRIKCGLFSIH